ncbi:MAG: translocation and assembly module protein TamB, partial [Paraburkholderia sp.]|nr:translocation and assembly module protein TamB [Paraburkholderia sp.]
MTTDASANPPPDPAGAAPPDGPDGAGTPPPPAPRRRRLWRRLVWAVLAPVLIVGSIVGALYGVLTTERGTAYAWRAAVRLLDGRLAGTLDGGTIASGLRLRHVEWRSLDGSGTDIKVDRIAGSWAVSHEPWRFVIDYLHVGTIEARIAPSGPSSGPVTLPHDLQLPMQLQVRDLRVDQLLLHEGASTTEFSRFVFHASSDGRHHMASVDRLETPFGAVTAAAKLDGVKPFPLTGDVGYSGKVNEEPVQVNAHLTGTLETLVAEVEANGLKLTGHARVEATPFAEVPLQRATVTFDHVNPQAFAPGAPFADLALRAELQPAGLGRAGKAGEVASGASGPVIASDAASAVNDASGAHAGHKAAGHPAKAGAFAVAGTISIVNARPGAIDEHLLPLIDARADVRLDAEAQHISNLNVRIVRNATVTGGGSLEGRRGQFNLQVAGLDLNALEASVRPTQLSGPIGIRLNDDTQSITLDLNDQKSALRAQGKVTIDPARMSFTDVRVTAGKGRIDLSGAIKHDASSTYNLKATLTDFDPLALTSQMPSRTAAAPAMGPAAAHSTHPAPAKPAANHPAGGRRPIEARVNGTITAAGVLAPTFTTKADFRLGESVYDGLPLTGGGTIQLAGSRLLPSHASLSIAGNDVDLQGSFGARGDRLRFKIDAPQLDRLGFGIAGFVTADGDLTGTIDHPDVTLNYKAEGVEFGANRIGHAEGYAELRDGANGALVFTTDARNVSAAGVELATLTVQLRGTRANHSLDAEASGKVHDHPLDLTLAANGHLTDARDGPHWDGTVTQLQNRGTPEVKLDSPLTVSAAAGRITLGATRMTLEDAVLDLKSFVFERGHIRSAGSITGISVARLMELRRQMTGEPGAVKTDLVFDGDWDFALADTATGHIQLRRRAGDVTVEVGRGVASLGVTDISARADFSGGNRLNMTLHAGATRLGVIDANASTNLVTQDGLLTISEEAPLSGSVNANIPSLMTTGGLFGPSYLLDGHLALKLALTGTVAKPSLSGTLMGDGLSATLVDQGVQLKDGVIHIALSENLVDFQQVEFHGASGTLRASGEVKLGGPDPD